ncbi:MAG: FAD-binding oxidoreductase [Terracidiphilus sp.]
MSAELTLDQGLDRLGGIVGTEHTRLRGETIVASPADALQIAEALRFARSNGLTVTPTGSSSKLGWGNPVDADIELSLTRLQSLREHAWQDMTCTVEAGCAWDAMQAELCRHGQMVALDPLWCGRATVGGIVATNDSGALRLKFGGLRDLILGMTLVLADGTIARSGGKVVKNVAGYDLHKLMTGSLGTLGVIADVNFRLHPVEKHARTWTVVAPHGASADPAFFEAPIRALMDSQLTISSVQLRVTKRECALDIRICTLPECLDEQASRMQSFFGNVALGEADEAVWQARQRLFDRDGSLILKASTLPGEVCSVNSEMQQWSAEKGCAVEVVAQATGLLTISVNADSDAAVALIERLRKRLEPNSGYVVALRLPDSLRGKIDGWGPAPGALPLMREIKRRFDPGRTLSPGRFLGGI